MFKSTFKSLVNVTPEVLYPIPDFTAFNLPIDEPTDDLIPKKKKPVFLSINRYERKKNLELNLKALRKYGKVLLHVSFFIRKLVYWVSCKVRHKQAYTATEACQTLEISGLETGEIINTS